VVCKPRLEGVAVSVAVDVLALGWTSGSRSALVGASVLVSNAGPASRPTAVSISVSRLVAESVLGLGVSPGSASVAASGTVTKGASPSKPESGLAAVGGAPSSRNPPVAPVCKSSRHAGQVNTKRARSHLVEPKSFQRFIQARHIGTSGPRQKSRSVNHRTRASNDLNVGQKRELASVRGIRLAPRKRARARRSRVGGGRA
jgi:hypothetical protein